MSGVEENVNVVDMVVWEGSTFVIDSLLKKEDFRHLSLEVISKILLEVIIFLLHICDREIFLMFGSEKRALIMDQVLANVCERLEKYDECILRKHFGEKTRVNLTRYFDYLSKMAPSTDFQNAYNERQREYSSYKELLPEKGKPLKNTLVWEFSKKVAVLVDEKPNPVIIMTLSLLVSDLIIVCKNTLKTTLKTNA